MSAVYSTPKTDWSLTSEEGISTADLNRIEENTDYIKEEWGNYRVIISGNWPASPLLSTLLQPIHIAIPADYQLVLDYVNYYYEDGDGYSRDFTIGEYSEIPGAEYFDSSVDNAGLSSGGVKLQRVIYNNGTDAEVGINIGVYIVGNANVNAGWSVEFVKLPI